MVTSPGMSQIAVTCQEQQSNVWSKSEAQVAAKYGRFTDLRTFTYA